MVARVLAILAAIAMVAGALVVRNRMDESDERTSTTLRLVCATELESVCDTLAAQTASKVTTVVEPAATTADRLANLAPGGKPDMDGWLVTAPWPEIVTQLRARIADAPLVTSGPVLGRSPVVLAVRADRETVLTNQCKGTPEWKCLGQVAGKPWKELPGGQEAWGPVKPGHPPISSAAGLTVIGGATVQYFNGNTDLSSADLEDEGFVSWLTRIEKAVPDRSLPPLQTMLLRPTFDAVGALEAEAGPLIHRAGGSKPVLIYPSPVVTADVVLAKTAGPAAGLLGDLVSGRVGRHALARSGWRVPAQALAAGIAPMGLPPSSNLPDPGFLQALRLRVEQASPR